ncbi:Hypothetical protein A7982_10282 [Minicystis rosea]|nr:Hypothetical protein A7982_10282 [Minicystis rosea]
MHPGMMAWWKWKQAARHGHCDPHAGPDGEHGGFGHHGGFRHGGFGGVEAAGDHFDSDFGGGSFGVRRPLRFLAHRLDLDDKQVEELAQILNELKTERAQSAVDNRRTTAGFADVISDEAFDAEKVTAVATERVKSAERLRDALVKALGRIHAILRKEQRAKLAYLIRTGALSL